MITANNVWVYSDPDVHIELRGTKHTLCNLALVGGEVTVTTHTPVTCEKCKEACKALIRALQACLPPVTYLASIEPPKIKPLSAEANPG